jgi:hypothetical protein
MDVEKIINDLVKHYPSLYVRKRIFEYELISQRDNGTFKAIIANKTTTAGYLIVLEAEVKVITDNGVLVADYNHGYEKFEVRINNIEYSYEYTPVEKTVFVMSENQMYSFLTGRALDWIKSNFKMPYEVEKLLVVFYEREVLKK